MSPSIARGKKRKRIVRVTMSVFFDPTRNSHRTTFFFYDILLLFFLYGIIRSLRKERWWTLDTFEENDDKYKLNKHNLESLRSQLFFNVVNSFGVKKHYTNSKPLSPFSCTRGAVGKVWFHFVSSAAVLISTFYLVILRRYSLSKVSSKWCNVDWLKCSWF